MAFFCALKVSLAIEEFYIHEEPLGYTASRIPQPLILHKLVAPA